MVSAGRATLPVSRTEAFGPERYALAAGLCLERFDDEALLLVAARNRLLTVNAAAADLFALASEAFGNQPFSLEQGYAWLAGEYLLDAQACQAKARGLLAFGLRHGLVVPAGPQR